MKTPIYEHLKGIVLKVEDDRNEKENKRCMLEITIDNKKQESIIVILKNPSRATKEFSDKTVYTVTKYIHKNSDKFPALKYIGKIIILNLIPFYETDSSKLINLKHKIYDKENLNIINDFCKKYQKVIIAWGNHPKGLRQEYEELKKEVFEILKSNNNNLFYVDKFSIKKNPKHGQVWSYADSLKEYELCPKNTT